MNQDLRVSASSNLTESNQAIRPGEATLKASSRFSDRTAFLIALVVALVVAIPVQRWESYHNRGKPVHIVQKLGTRVIYDVWTTNQVTIHSALSGVDQSQVNWWHQFMTNQIRVTHVTN